MLAVVAFVCMHHATSANNFQQCWASNVVTPFAWAFRNSVCCVLNLFLLSNIPSIILITNKIKDVHSFPLTE